MIFIVLGTQKFQLNRLLKLMDRYISSGVIKEEVFAQIGFSDYLPKHYDYVEFLDKADFEAKIQEADLVIAHSGVGTIINAINAGKPVIVFPRLSKYKEHVDDHQKDIAYAFSKKKFVLFCEEENDLIDIIEKSRTFHFEHYVSQRKRIVNLVENFIQTNGEICSQKECDLSCREKKEY